VALKGNKGNVKGFAPGMFRNSGFAGLALKSDFHTAIPNSGTLYRDYHGSG